MILGVVELGGGHPRRLNKLSDNDPFHAYRIV
jgi:hypothetical protein